MKNIKILVLSALLVGTLGAIALLSSVSVSPKVQAQASCKHENAECDINASVSECCAGLTCTIFNEQSGASKCEGTEVDPTATPTPTPTPEDECDPQEEECVITPTPTPTPTPEPTQPPNTGGPGDGLSDGRSDGGSSCPECTKAPTGQVLGATTEFAATGVAEDILMNVVGIIGLVSTAAGIMIMKRNSK